VFVAVLTQEGKEAEAATPFDYEKYGIKVPPPPEGPLQEYPDLSRGPQGESSLFQFSAVDADGKKVNLKYSQFFPLIDIQHF
jgi:hypothetical protein